VKKTITDWRIIFEESIGQVRPTTLRKMVAVGMAVTRYTPHRSGRARLTHPIPTSSHRGCRL